MEQSRSEAGEVPLATRPADQSIPSLSRESMERIRQAEKKARDAYDLDKTPYFPTNVEFSFQEASVFRSIERIIAYQRIFAEAVLDAHLTEYLTVDPLAVLSNEAMLQTVSRNTWTLTDELWRGYSEILRNEPSSRSARCFLASHLKNLEQFPELESWRYPTANRWTDFLERMAEPDSEFARLGHLHEDTIRKTIRARIRQFQDTAASRLPSQMAGVGELQATHVSATNAVVPKTKAEKVDEFLARVLSETGKRVNRTHIWKLAGHNTARQFEYWQESNAKKATAADEINFARILEMAPAKFLDDLRKARHFSG